MKPTATQRVNSFHVTKTFTPQVQRGDGSIYCYHLHSASDHCKGMSEESKYSRSTL